MCVGVENTVNMFVLRNTLAAKIFHNLRHVHRHSARVRLVE